MAEQPTIPPPLTPTTPAPPTITPPTNVVGKTTGGTYNPLQVPPVEPPSSLTPLFVFPPAVALTDKLVPRYKVIPLDEYWDNNTPGGAYQEGSFADATRGAFRVGEEPTDVANYESLLGNPVYSTLEFPQKGPLEAMAPVGILANQKGKVALRIDMAIVEINQTKNIVKTVIAGRNGTVKEYIGLGDFEINIQGAVVSKYNTYPEDEVLRLIEILSLNTQIPIAGGMFGLFNIQWVVVEDFRIRELEGTRNVVPFNIRCISDKDDTIVIGDRNVIW